MPKKKKPSNTSSTKRKNSNSSASKGTGGPAGSYLTNKKTKKNRLDRAGNIWGGSKKKGK